MNNMTTNKNSKVEISCSGFICFLMFLAFFFAKIFDKIDWSWWWVFSPLWIPLVFCLGLVVVAAIIYLFVMLFVIIIDLWKK